MADQWGIFDTVDQLWIGNDEGVRLFETEALAKVCAMVVDVRLGHGPGRHRSCLWPGGTARLRDEVPTQMGTLEALEHLEGGKL